VAEGKPNPSASVADSEEYRSILRAATGASNPSVQNQMVDQVLGALWVPSELSGEKRIALMAAGVALLQGIKPQDEIEGMLASHMVATHSAAMECLRRNDLWTDL
jgi:hypothetical protein